MLVCRITLRCGICTARWDVLFIRFLLTYLLSAGVFSCVPLVAQEQDTVYGGEDEVGGGKTCGKILAGYTACVREGEAGTCVDILKRYISCVGEQEEAYEAAVEDRSLDVEISLLPMVQLGYSMPYQSEEIVGSWSYSLGLSYHLYLDKGHRHSFLPSVTWGRQRYRFMSERYTLASNAREGAYYLPVAQRIPYEGDYSVKSSTFSTQYLDALLTYKYELWGHGEVGIAGMVGYLLNTEVRLQYTHSGFDHKLSTTEKDHYVSRYRYGGMVFCGISGIRLYFKQYFSPIFLADKGPGGYTGTLGEFGLMFN